MNNLVLGKNTSASNFVKPYSPSRAADGSLTPTSRWLTNQIPSYMVVDFGGEYWIGSWRVSHMPTAGWPTPDYVVSSYKLQGSLDNNIWFNIDSVSNNVSYITERAFTAVKARYVKLVIDRGLYINPKLASIMELAVYETAPPSTAFLSKLLISNGNLAPAFNKNIASYADAVGYDTEFVNVTPSAETAGATITVNGNPVKSGEASQSIPLTAGTFTPISIAVKSGTDSKTYTVNVTRASSPYLSNIAYNGGRGATTLNPAFNTKTFDYTAIAKGNPVKITPTSQDINAKITVDGQSVQSGQECSVDVTTKPKTVAIQVTSAIGNDTKTYTIVIS